MKLLKITFTVLLMFSMLSCSSEVTERESYEANEVAAWLHLKFKG
jgi:hypothetical protein